MSSNREMKINVVLKDLIRIFSSVRMNRNHHDYEAPSQCW